MFDSVFVIVTALQLCYTVIVPNQFSHPWTDQEIDYIKTNIGILTYVQMGLKINRSYSSIQSKIRFLPFQKKVKKYSLNSSFFKKWSPQMAYVLGLIAADGNVYHAGRAHVLHLASDDLDIIEKIKPILQFEGKIHQKKRDNGKISYSLRICDKTLFDDLVSLGITERKSLTLNPPVISRIYLNHFLRGFFDGDGSVTLVKRSKIPRLNTAFYTASLSMANFLYNHLRSKLNDLYLGRVMTKTTHRNTEYYHLSLGHKASEKLFNYLYRDAKGLYIDRKYNKFMEGIYYGQSV